MVAKEKGEIKILQYSQVPDPNSQWVSDLRYSLAIIVVSSLVLQTCSIIQDMVQKLMAVDLGVEVFLLFTKP